MVGAAGLEPATSCTPSKRASQLRYAPNQDRILPEHLFSVNGPTRTRAYPGRNSRTPDASMSSIGRYDNDKMALTKC